MSEENNELNVEQIAEAFNANEELRGQLLETISSNEHGKSYLDNYAKNYFESNIGTKIGEVHGAYDKDFEEVLGVKKPDGVKSYAFWKEQAAKLKEAASSSDPALLESIKNENAELKSKIENNEQAKYFKDMYESTKNSYSEQLKEKEGVIQQFEQKQRTFTIEGELNKALNSIKLNDSLPEDVKATYLQTVYSSLLSEAKILEDGSIVFYENGEPITNKKTANKATASEILNNKLKSIVAQAPTTTGGGGQESNGTKKSNVTFSNASTKLELQSLVETSLLADGLLKGTNDFTTKMDGILAEYGKGLPLR
jgi:hypothetical protein